MNPLLPEFSLESKTRRKTRLLCSASLWLGALAAFPYLLSLFLLLFQENFVSGPFDGWPGNAEGQILPWLAIPLLTMGRAAGIPLGVAALLTGGYGLKGKGLTRPLLLRGLLGLLLGLGGILGHLWFLYSMTFYR